MTTIAQLIASDHDAIIAGWLAEASRAASARGLDAPQLINVMPQYLRALAGGEDGHAHLESHFSTRLRQGFQLAEIIEELALLGRCVVSRFLTLPEGARPAASEVDALHDRLHHAAAAIVALFDAHMREDEQTEKRYIRLLRDVASAALRTGTSALTGALRELLAIVMDAMGAQSAAIMIREGDRRLVTAATAGAEPLQAYAASMGNHSFAASVAESELATALWDVSSTELDVPDSLRQSGIHSLLGVQLRSRTGLLGVLYVGIATTRAFTPGETGRLEMLAEQLVAHLDGAALFDRLNSTIAALRTERSIHDHFVAVLAHDLRGPLTAAKLGADALGRDPPRPETRRDLVARVERNLARMDAMIRDLLDTARLRAGGRLPLAIDHCDLARLVREVAEELRTVYGERFTVDIDPEIVGMWSADELRRALWNLGANAAKYGAGDRPIDLRVHQVDGHARIEVHNWGDPIAPEDQGHLFDPFARTRAGVATGKLGWGLGLALVRGCVEAHGGTLGVTSNAEEGTTFTVDIPLDARPYQEAAPEIAPSIH